MGSAFSGHMYAKHKEYLTLYLASFDLGQNGQQFVFPALELEALAVCICCGSGPTTVSMASQTKFGIPILGGITLVLIAGFYEFRAQLFKEFQSCY